MTPEQVKAMPAFFRYQARVEMRCSTAFQRPSIGDVLDGEMRAWLETKGLALPAETRGADAVAIRAQRAALAAAVAGGHGNGIEALPAPYQLVGNSVVGREETHELATRALAIAQAQHAPAMAQLALAIQVRGTARADTWKGDIYSRIMTPLLADPLYAADPQARSTIRLIVSDGKNGNAERAALLRQIIDDSALAANDPMRVGALIRLASIRQEAGDAAAARTIFAQSGLAANQCAILDSPPRLEASGGTFPNEARQWGFEGWTRTQFDVNADGKTGNTRAILSYPPFVFTAAGVQTLATARFSKTYRPDGEVGCGGLSRNVKFILG